MTDIPVRSCCGQRHLGAQCPDDLVLCSLCLERVPVDRLNVTDEGKLEDVCLPCANQEKEALARRMEGW